MATITNITQLSAKLDKLKIKVGNPNPSVIVGFSTNYALHVHENIEMTWRGLPRHKPSKGNYWDGTGGAFGQAKYLEQPARELAKELVRIVITAMGNGATLMQCLYLAGLRLQREAQLLVPVDTGNLKASAFTKKEKSESGPST